MPTVDSPATASSLDSQANASCLHPVGRVVRRLGKTECVKQPSSSTSSSSQLTTALDSVTSSSSKSHADVSCLHPAGDATRCLGRNRVCRRLTWPCCAASQEKQSITNMVLGGRIKSNGRKNNQAQPTWLCCTRTILFHIYIYIKLVSYLNVKDKIFPAGATSADAESWCLIIRCASFNDSG